MVFFPVISFVLLLLFGSVDSFGACPSMPQNVNMSRAFQTQAECLENTESCPTTYYNTDRDVYYFGLNSGGSGCFYSSMNGYGYHRFCQYNQCSTESPDTY